MLNDLLVLKRLQHVKDDEDDAAGTGHCHQDIPTGVMTTGDSGTPQSP